MNTAKINRTLGIMWMQLKSVSIKIIFLALAVPIVLCVYLFICSFVLMCKTMEPSLLVASNSYVGTKLLEPFSLNGHLKV